MKFLLIFSSVFFLITSAHASRTEDFSKYLESRKMTKDESASGVTPNGESCKVTIGKSGLTIESSLYSAMTSTGVSRGDGCTVTNGRLSENVFTGYDGDNNSYDGVLIKTDGQNKIREIQYFEHVSKLGFSMEQGRHRSCNNLQDRVSSSEYTFSCLFN